MIVELSGSREEGSAACGELRLSGLSLTDHVQIFYMKLVEGLELTDDIVLMGSRYEWGLPKRGRYPVPQPAFAVDGSRRPSARKLGRLATASPCLPGAFAVELVAREALNNAVIHGNAGDEKKRVTFELRCGKEKWVRLSVSDQGPGFRWRNRRRDLPSPQAAGTVGVGFLLSPFTRSESSSTALATRSPFGCRKPLYPQTGENRRATRRTCPNNLSTGNKHMKSYTIERNGSDCRVVLQPTWGPPSSTT